MKFCDSRGPLVLRTECNPVRDGWVPAVWLGMQLIGCYELCKTESECKAAGRFHALQYYRSRVPAAPPADPELDEMQRTLERLKRILDD